MKRLEMRVRPRVIYGAEQYWPGDVSELVKNDFKGPKCDSVFGDDPMTPHVHTSQNEVVLLRPGDWIITSKEGVIIEVVSNRDLYEKYDPVVPLCPGK